MEIAGLLDALDDDRIAEIADVCEWLADDPRNTASDYPGPSWDEDEPWSLDDVVTLAADAA